MPTGNKAETFWLNSRTMAVRGENKGDAAGIVMKAQFPFLWSRRAFAANFHGFYGVKL